ncbi:17719_t:CDS:2, partial [Funneliformis geosporum]
DHTIIQPEIRREDFSYTNRVRARAILQRAIIDQNSKVDHKLRGYANQLVKTYLNEMLLKVRPNKPYEVGNVKVERDERKCHNFKNALHEKYSGLNGLEIRTASALDSLEKDKLERKLLRIYEPTVEMIDEAPKKVCVIIIIQYGNPLKDEEIYYRVWYRKRNFDEIGNAKVKTINEAIRVMLKIYEESELEICMGCGEDFCDNCLNDDEFMLGSSISSSSKRLLLLLVGVKVSRMTVFKPLALCYSLPLAVRNCGNYVFCVVFTLTESGIVKIFELIGVVCFSYDPKDIIPLIVDMGKTAGRAPAPPPLNAVGVVFGAVAITLDFIDLFTKK